MEDDIYSQMPGEGLESFKGRADLKAFYSEFLKDFKHQLRDFVRESAVDLSISQIEVGNIPQKLFFGEYGGMYVTLKNQGKVSCYLTTDKKGAYRLDPDEKERFWLNQQTTIVTLSGNTIVGYIRS